jgi:hypothetical protein
MNLMLYTGANILKTLGEDDSIAITGVVVKVNDLSASLIDLFEDKQGTTPLTNPFVTDTSGQFHFYAAPGEYDLTATKNTVTSNMRIEVGLAGQVESVDIETNALTITSSDHGVKYNISDTTGSVSITVESVPIEAVGMIVFIQALTASPIQFIPAAGVTIRTAYSLQIYGQNSAVALMSDSEDVWTLVGDLAQ